MVEVRRRRWCVTQVDASSLLEKLNETQHLVSLESLEEDALGEELQVIWELEAGGHRSSRRRGFRTSRTLPPTIVWMRFWTPSAGERRDQCGQEQPPVAIPQRHHH